MNASTFTAAAASMLPVETLVDVLGFFKRIELEDIRVISRCFNSMVGRFYTVRGPAFHIPRLLLKMQKSAVPRIIVVTAWIAGGPHHFHFRTDVKRIADLADNIVIQTAVMDIRDCPDDDNSSEPTFKESVGLPWSIGGDMATNDIFGRLGRILCSADDAYLNLHNFVEGRGVMLNAMLATFFSDPCSAALRSASDVYRRLIIDANNCEAIDDLQFIAIDALLHARNRISLTAHNVMRLSDFVVEYLRTVRTQEALQSGELAVHADRTCATECMSVVLTFADSDLPMGTFSIACWGAPFSHFNAVNTTTNEKLKLTSNFLFTRINCERLS